MENGEFHTILKAKYIVAEHYYINFEIITKWFPGIKRDTEWTNEVYTLDDNGNRRSGDIFSHPENGHDWFEWSRKEISIMRAHDTNNEQNHSRWFARDAHLLLVKVLAG